jgi:hypothetical protein
MKILANDGLPGKVETTRKKSARPREFRRALSIEQQAECLSATSRARFLDTLSGGMYPDTESQLQLLKYYRIEDQIALLEAQEKETGGPMVMYRGRMVPNPLRKAIVDQYRESARYFRALGLDQEPRADKNQGKLFQ